MEELKITLAAARVNAGMTQEDVARKMQVSKNKVVDWEKGKKEPTISQGRQLSSLYGIPLSNIFFADKIQLN